MKETDEATIRAGKVESIKTMLQDIDMASKELGRRIDDKQTHNVVRTALLCHIRELAEMSWEELDLVG